MTFASRSGSSSGAIVLGCFAGPWRFTVSVVGLFGAGHREGRRMRIRRDTPTVMASKRVSPHGPVLRRRRCFGLASFPRGRPLVPFRLVKSGRDQSWDAGPQGSVSVSSRFLLSSRTPSRTRSPRSRKRKRLRGSRAGRNLVDPASSHMLVSKIKPCMSQYKLLYGETANGSLKQL